MTDLREAGIPLRYIKRLKAGYITTAEILAYSLEKEVSERTGISEKESLKIEKIAMKYLGITSEFRSAPEIEAEQKAERKIRTGFTNIDIHLRGGFPKGSVIEFRGPQWSGKTLFCSHLAVMVQAMVETGEPYPVVIWYDADGTFRPDTIREIAFRYRLDPEKILGNIYHVQVSKEKPMERWFETVASLHRTNRIGLVVIDSLMKARHCLKEKLTMPNYIGFISRMATATDALFLLTSRVMTDVSKFGKNEIIPQRSHVVSHTSNFGFNLEVMGKRERKIALRVCAGYPQEDWMIHIGYGGLYGSRAERNAEHGRVQRYVQKVKGIIR
jgi:archaellum biogenesis ATPase FlaH